MKKNPLEEAFGSEKRWVNWRYETVGGKKTKIPYAITGRKASSTDEKTWSTYEEAKAKSDQVGIVFTPDATLLGIDIDHCIENNKIVHEQKEKIERFLSEAASYVEVSPSQTGLHLFLRISESLVLESHKKSPFECYSSGRYFTVTLSPYGKEKKIRTVSAKLALELLGILGYPWKETVQKEEKVIQSSNRQLTSLDDSTVIEKMFSSKNGAEIKTLFNGDISKYNNDDSSADMALCSHLAFWCAKDAAQMERLWLQSTLGSRKKTRERKDYRDRTIKAAIDSCKEVYETSTTRTMRENPEVELMYTLNREKEKIFTQNTENMRRIMSHHPKFMGRLRYDLFKNQLEIKSGNIWRGLEDNDAVIMQTSISIQYPCFAKVGKDMIYDAMILVAKENAIDSACDWIRSKRWDGKPRLDSWLSMVYGVPEDAYHKAVGSNWIKGMVKRIIEPGCKFDYVLVLEGEQGSKKSTSLYVLGGPWHLETAMSTETKDFFMQMQGKAIIEFSEGETLSRTEVKRMKAIITMQSDKYRPPYERNSQDFPRRCVFAMTTNQDEYLKDETGNRRWLPVRVEHDEANVDWLEQNREQLFAEAYVRAIDRKETIYEFPKDETRAMQDSRRIHDPNSDIIEDWYWNKLDDMKRADGVTVFMVYRDVLHGGFNARPMNRFEEMSIADVLKNTLNLEMRRLRVDGKRSSRWYSKEKKIIVEKTKSTVEERITKELDTF